MKCIELEAVCTNGIRPGSGGSPRQGDQPKHGCPMPGACKFPGILPASPCRTCRHYYHREFLPVSSPGRITGHAAPIISPLSQGKTLIATWKKGTIKGQRREEDQHLWGRAGDVISMLRVENASSSSEQLPVRPWWGEVNACPPRVPSLQ